MTIKTKELLFYMIRQLSDFADGERKCVFAIK